MKVLIINHFPLTGSGSGVYAQNLATSLIKLGHTVKIIVPENNDKIKDNNIYHHVYFNNGNISFNFPCFTTHPRSNTTFYELNNDQLKQYISAFKEAIKEEIEDFKPDIIHSNHIWVLSALATYYDIPTIVTAHGTDIIGYNKDERYKKIAIEAAKRSKKIITVSKDNNKLVNKVFPFAKDKTLLIPNGYNPDVFYKDSVDKKETLNELGINKNYKKIVCFAGKFTEIKGIDTLIKAASIYEDDETLTLLSGDGILFNDMKKLAHNLKLKNIKFLGNQDHDTLRKIYNISNVSIIPSRNESFGLVAVEALACGTPVISTDVGGLNDIVNPKVGIKFPCNDHIALADDIKKVLDKEIVFDSDEIALSTKEKYSQDELIKELVKVYNNELALENNYSRIMKN